MNDTAELHAEWINAIDWAMIEYQSIIYHPSDGIAAKSIQAHMMGLSLHRTLEEHTQVADGRAGWIYDSALQAHRTRTSYLLQQFGMKIPSEPVKS